MIFCPRLLALAGFVLGGGLVPAMALEHHLTAKSTLSVIEMDRHDVLVFRLANGEVRRFELLETAARVLFTTLGEPRRIQPDGGTLYEMTCRLRVDGQPMELRRYVCSQEAFYEPYVINGVRLWFDAVSAVEQFLTFGHGECKPTRHVRFALQDVTQRICPEEVLPWHENPARFISIGDTHAGDDCWMGPFGGLDAHGGLDINQKAGTLNFAPIAFDDHYFFESLAQGHDNNRWRGIRRWPNGDVWALQTHHLLALLVPEHTPLSAGTPFCTAAGVKYGGAHQHSHYVFKVHPAGATAEVLIDPWIIFWQSFEDRKHRTGDLAAAMAPVAPAIAGTAVRFSSAGSRPGPGRTALECRWSFGDGGWADGAEVEHVFAGPGVYPVTLTVSDGAMLATCTQHITVNGAAVTKPVLALVAPDEPAFRLRPVAAMDTYGIAPKFLPGSLEFVARAQRPRPGERQIGLRNLGTGALAPARAQVEYLGGAGWLAVTVDGTGNAQRIRLQPNATGLPGALYRARVVIAVPGAENGRQSVVVSLLVPTHPALPPISRRIQFPKEKVVDDDDARCYATPWFWIGHRFARVPRGQGGFHLTNGGRAAAGEFVRYAPDLAGSRYEVSLAAETPYAADVRFQVRVRHAQGEDRVWMEPARSRRIGSFAFEDGTDGFVEILAEGSAGQVLADAVIFRRIAAEDSAATAPALQRK
jgi:PKD repeat protein